MSSFEAPSFSSPSYSPSSSYNSPSSLSSDGNSKAKLQEAVQSIQLMMAMEAQKQIMENMTSRCFDKCISKPSSSALGTLKAFHKTDYNFFILCYNIAY